MPWRRPAGRCSIGLAHRQDVDGGTVLLLRCRRPSMCYRRILWTRTVLLLLLAGTPGCAEKSACDEAPDKLAPVPTRASPTACQPQAARTLRTDSGVAPRIRIQPPSRTDRSSSSASKLACSRCEDCPERGVDSDRACTRLPRWTATDELARRSQRKSLNRDRSQSILGVAMAAFEIKLSASHQCIRNH
jgi:hypothetical protein